MIASAVVLSNPSNSDSVTTMKTIVSLFFLLLALLPQDLRAQSRVDSGAGRDRVVITSEWGGAPGGCAHFVLYSADPGQHRDWEIRLPNGQLVTIPLRGGCEASLDVPMPMAGWVEIRTFYYGLAGLRFEMGGPMRIWVQANQTVRHSWGYCR